MTQEAGPSLEGPLCPHVYYCEDPFYNVPCMAPPGHEGKHVFSWASAQDDVWGGRDGLRKVKP